MLGFKREKKDEDDSLFEVSEKIDKRLTCWNTKQKFQQGSITLSFTPTTVDVATKLTVLLSAHRREERHKERHMKAHDVYETNMREHTYGSANVRAHKGEHICQSTHMRAQKRAHI